MERDDKANKANSRKKEVVKRRKIYEESHRRTAQKLSKGEGKSKKSILKG